MIHFQKYPVLFSIDKVAFVLFILLLYSQDW